MVSNCEHKNYKASHIGHDEWEGKCLDCGHLFSFTDDSNDGDTRPFVVIDGVVYTVGGTLV